MNKFTYIFKSLIHYKKANLLIALGVALSAAVITGGLIIGDSITHSLELTTNYRLGKTTHVLTSTDRYFRQQLAADMPKTLDVSPVMISEGMAVSRGGEKRANRVQVVGIDSTFYKIATTDLYSVLGKNEIIISQNLAEKLEVRAGDNILIRINKASLIPKNAPFVSGDETSVSYRATIKSIATKDELGRFSLKNSQTAPYNLFMDLQRLNELMEFQSKANRLLINSELSENELFTELKKYWQAEDANLVFRKMEKTGKYEIYSERVFIEDNISRELKKLKGANPILTYFTNSISNIQNKSVATPYSFVSTLPDSLLNPNEIILNRWTAEDISAQIGDSVKLKYFTIGPLRQLKVDSASFRVKRIVSMNSEFADPSLMPNLPGMSDAGDCGDWEAGIPIDLESIRDKDEDYWDLYKGTPKAFLAQSTARKLWANRFGSTTSVRFDENSLSEDKYRTFFKENISPESLGFYIDPVKEKGIYAAQNGVDFSQLFIGLSFFILVAAVLLSMLLYLLHLENRYTQIGTLSTLGFKEKQIKTIFLTEALMVSMVGSIIGLFAAIFYTKMVFKALNSLWFDIVRTNVLEIMVLPKTLIIGFIISTLVSGIVILFAIRKKLKMQTSELQRKISKHEKRGLKSVKRLSSILFFVGSAFIIAWQLNAGETQNPGMFFMAGGLLLISLLLFSDLIIRNETINTATIKSINLVRKNIGSNKNRSLTIILLFAFGTFLVVSTGSNKQDLFANANDKTTGSGGFKYFAETTLPVLFDLNNQDLRQKEGLPKQFTAIQFRKVEGDDASCLNLNRISNPAILGVNTGELNGRFSFVAKTELLDGENPWESLQKDLGDVVPAIADQTVIQWGLGLKVGDTLSYQNETGDTLKLKLIGGLAPSIFQGYVIIDNQHFLNNYPSSSGSSVFLIDAEENQEQEVAESLEFMFRDYGWEAISAPQRLAAFYSITNTYLSIFLALGALGLIIGTIGLAVVLARSILERKSEIALLQVVGFTKNKIFMLVVKEYSILLFAGVLIGLITAVLATLPSILSPNTDISLGTIILVVGIIILNGLFWIFLLSATSLKSKPLIGSLRSE